LDFEDNANLKCLQSTEESGVCLLMIKPWDYFKDYEIEMSDEEIDELDIKNEQDVIVYNIITVRENKISANLVAPVVINVINKNGRQIILSNAKYDIRQEIKCL
jgi:flagellar assembly factor FliW